MEHTQQVSPYRLNLQKLPQYSPNTTKFYGVPDDRLDKFKSNRSVSVEEAPSPGKKRYAGLSQEYPIKKSGYKAEVFSFAP